MWGLHKMGLLNKKNVLPEKLLLKYTYNHEKNKQHVTGANMMTAIFWIARVKTCTSYKEQMCVLGAVGIGANIYKQRKHFHRLNLGYCPFIFRLQGQLSCSSSSKLFLQVSLSVFALLPALLWNGQTP